MDTGVKGESENEPLHHNLERSAKVCGLQPARAALLPHTGFNQTFADEPAWWSKTLQG